VSKACPNCMLINPDTNLRCKCGHDLTKVPPLPPEPTYASEPSVPGGSVEVLGLIGTLVGAGFAILGGLMALFVFVKGHDMTSGGVVGALGCYFIGKGVAIAGLGLLGFEQCRAK